MFLSTVNPNPDLRFLSPSSLCNSISTTSIHTSFPFMRFPFSPSLLAHHFSAKKLSCFAVSKKSDSQSGPVSGSNTNSEPKRNKTQSPKDKIHQLEDEDSRREFPTTKPKKSRRGRRSEVAAVEDFVRDSLERTFSSIRQQNSEIMENKETVLKENVNKETDSDAIDSDNDDEDDDDEQSSGEKGKKMVVEEESSNWPVDADVGWGIRASEYFEKHPIKNVIGEDGIEIDWEGEMDDNWVNEINLLEWENYAFHPSPLILLVFERYNRASDNWKALKELEKAAKVYWGAKDRLPPRTVKIDMNIEKDLAYALKVRESPQILFLRGNRILYREKEIRSGDELVEMIAHFYYKAKKPSFMKER